MGFRLVARALDWRWSSLWRRVYGTPKDRACLGAWPLPKPRDWPERVNRPQIAAEREAIRRSVARGQPYGDEHWGRQTAGQLGLESTLRSRGSPCKAAS